MENAKSMEYWLQESALICEFMVFGALAAAIFVAVKFERFWSRGRGKREDYVYDNVLWRPCWRALHPAGLMAYRAIVFLFMAVVLAFDLHNGGIHIYYFYTDSMSDIFGTMNTSPYVESYKPSGSKVMNWISSGREFSCFIIFVSGGLLDAHYNGFR
ncbi:hypothetical protein SUGI_0522540 [Cryptomeria japonica]|nr:hypothetical protein SUGI_0522540 [Cryptomeria japonica]